jgi:hypothetical protein
VKKKAKKAIEPDKDIPKRPVPAPPEKNQFDFGGLPKRDLKKNLGCG